MTPQFQKIYEGVLKTIGESRTKGSKTSGKTILVVFDKSSPVKTAKGMKPMLDEMRKEYFTYLMYNYTEEHGAEDAKKFAPMFTPAAMKKAWDAMVTVRDFHADKDPEKGDVMVATVDINAGVVNDLMNKLIKDKYFTYHYSVAPVVDIFLGSSYQGVMDPKENPLVQANERLKAKYQFVADELAKADVYTGQQARKQTRQKFLRQ